VAIPLASSGEIQMEQIDVFLSVAEHCDCSEDAVSRMYLSTENAPRSSRRGAFSMVKLIDQ
jgi:hypothetical protein